MADDSQQRDKEDLDRELIELLNELRVALPGVQVLFAFLLAVPFSQRFAETTELQRDAYMAALLSTLAGSVFLIAPSAYHRIRFRDRDKEALLLISNVFAIIGMVFLAVGMTAVVFLVTSPAWPQEKPVVGLIPKAQKPIAMDGKLTDPQLFRGNRLRLRG